MSLARPSRRLPADWPLWAGILAVEGLAIGAYLLSAGRVSNPRYLVYPFVWINVGLYVLTRGSAPATNRRRRALAAAVALAYAAVLAVVTGMIGLPLSEHGHVHATAHGWFVSLSAPGWGPRIGYVAEPYHAYFVPYRAVGYAALGYLLYADLCSLSAAAGAGAIGLFACVGCAFPLVTSALGGAGAATLSTVGGLSLDLSTAAFLAAAGLLWWPVRTG